MATWNMLTIYLFINLRRHMLRYDSVPFKFAMNSLGKTDCIPILGYGATSMSYQGKQSLNLSQTNLINVRVEIFMVNMLTVVFWVVTLCSFVGGCQCCS
jgi:hypothetical protein